MNRCVENVNLEFLAGLKFQLFANGLWDHNLKFWRNLYGIHEYTPDERIDSESVCQ